VIGAQKIKKEEKRPQSTFFKNLGENPKKHLGKSGKKGSLGQSGFEPFCFPGKRREFGLLKGDKKVFPGTRRAAFDPPPLVNVLFKKRKKE